MYSFVAILIAAATALAAPRGTINLTATTRTGSSTGGPFLVANESYTRSFVLGLRGLMPSDSFVCDDAANPCYEVDVNLDLPADYAATHPTDVVRVTLTWDPQASDLDMHIYRPPYDTASGQPFRSSRNNPPAAEVAEFPVVSGRSTYRVYVLPAIPAAVSGTVTAAIVTGPPPPEGGGTVATGGPNFTNYRPPAGLTTYAESVSEPTMGVNIGSNKAYMLFTLDTLEASFDDFTSPATATWRNLGRGGAPTTADPFLTVDQHRLPDGSANNRVWIAQLLAATSYMAHNDRQESTTWTRSLTGPGEIHGVDNQSIAVGPYPNNQKPSTARSDANYPHAMYYCSHSGANAFCSRSDDGGLTFNTSKPIFPLAGACSNHGHVKVGPDGTVYVPMNNSCEGAEGVSISIDAGETWHYITVPGTVSGRWDSSIAIANDGKTVYYGYGEESDDRAMIIKGTLDKSDPSAPTIRWQVPAVDVGAAAGLVNIVFPTVVAGDPDRAAFLFHGTTTEGDSGDQASFPANAEWYLYVATTFDGGKSWQLRNITPGDPTQRGSICDGGTGCDNDPDDRNLLDFMDADIDGEGRILVGYSDGCVDACVGALPNSYTARGYIARQSDGKRMYAQFDPAPPANTPGSPALRGTRNSHGVSLTWSTPNAGQSPITSYIVERSTGDGAFRNVATMTATAARYDDATAIDPASSYRYRVSAANAFGTGAPSNTVTPVVPQQSVCTPPGVTVQSDGTGDALALATLYGMPVGVANPAVTDLTSLSISQPYVPGGALSLMFQIKTAAGGTLPPNVSWLAAFTNPTGVVYAVRMVTDATGVARFESYKVGAASSGLRRGEFIEGLPTRVEGNYSATTGLITIVVPGANVGMTAAGTVTNFFAMSTLLPADRASSPLDMMPNDGVASGSLEVKAVSVCGPNQAPRAHLSATMTSRKPLVVALDASASFDPDSTSTDPQLRDTIVKYVFDFGDGTPPVATTEPRISHTYPGAGSWRASVTVQDSRGRVSEAPAYKQICDSCFKKK